MAWMDYHNDDAKPWVRLGYCVTRANSALISKAYRSKEKSDEPSGLPRTYSMSWTSRGIHEENIDLSQSFLPFQTQQVLTLMQLTSTLICKQDLPLCRSITSRLALSTNESDRLGIAYRVNQKISFLWIHGWKVFLEAIVKAEIKKE